MTAIPGRYNTLEMLRSTEPGIFLDGGEAGDILMPGKYVPQGAEVGDMIPCFVYFDSEDRLVATAEKPFVQVGECALLRCVATTKFGAFLDWGLAKDILVPHREQTIPMEEGRSYMVYVYLDERSKRIAASARIEKYLNKTSPDFEEGDEVQLCMARKTDAGWVAVINNTHTGLLYHNEIFKDLRVGDTMPGYISQLRPDGKTDLRLQKTGYKALAPMEQEFLNIVKKYGGAMQVGDKTSPEEIYRIFGMSKKNFKKIIGGLYRSKKLELYPDGIRLTEESGD